MKGLLVYCRIEKFYTAVSFFVDLSNKFVDWECFGYGWCLMDSFKLSYFVQFGQVHSHNRSLKFHGSIRKFFGCMDHNLAWLFDRSVNIIHWDFVMVSLTNNDLFKKIVPANSWKINLDQNWVPVPSLHKTTLVNDLPHSVSTVSITFFRQLIDVILLSFDFSVTMTKFLFLISLVTPLK